MPPSHDEVTKLALLVRKATLGPPAKEQRAVPHRNLRRHLSPQAIEELVARYTAGEQTPALSRELGISESGVRALLRAEGVTLRGHAITPEDAEQAVHLYESGSTITQVVTQIGYSHGTILSVLRKHGVVNNPGNQAERAVSGN